MGDAPHIPLVDLGWQHDQVSEEVEAGFAALFASSAYVQGPQVREFEEAFSAFCGGAHCIGVANGTDAIELLLRSGDVGPGAEVLLPANTFVATAEAVARTGATPVLVDVDEHHLIDVAQVERRRTARTRAVVPVHLYGQHAAVAEVREAVASDVLVVEDAAQAQGATRHGQPIGAVGDGAATSFYPGKNLGAYGDAGAVLTVDEERAARVRLLADHGSPRKHVHEIVGWNSRLDSLQAVVLHAKLRHLPAWNERRRAIAQHYDSLLAAEPRIERPSVAEGNVHVWHLYVVQVDRRDEVLASLQAAGIGASVHYPRPVHLQPAFAHLDRPGSHPVAERAAGRILSLPMHPGLTDAQVERVAELLIEAVAR